MKSQRPTTPNALVPDWLRLLAAAVVQQALTDASDLTLPAALRHDARQFLAGNADYKFWGFMAEGRVNNSPRHGRRVGVA